MNPHCVERSPHMAANAHASFGNWAIGSCFGRERVHPACHHPLQNALEFAAQERHS